MVEPDLAPRADQPGHAGLRIYQGKVVGHGEWQPLVDADTHRGLVAYLSDPTRANAFAFERRHMGSGVYRCGVCGGLLYAAYPRRGMMVYRCKQCTSAEPATRSTNT